MCLPSEIPGKLGLAIHFPLWSIYCVPCKWMTNHVIHQSKSCSLFAALCSGTYRGTFFSYCAIVLFGIVYGALFAFVGMSVFFLLEKAPRPAVMHTFKFCPVLHYSYLSTVVKRRMSIKINQGRGEEMPVILLPAFCLNRLCMFGSAGLLGFCWIQKILSMLMNELWSWTLSITHGRIYFCMQGQGKYVVHLDFMHENWELKNGLGFLN